MSENEQKALALVAEAEKKLNSSKTFLGGLFGYPVFCSFLPSYHFESCSSVLFYKQSYDLKVLTKLTSFDSARIASNDKNEKFLKTDKVLAFLKLRYLKMKWLYLHRMTSCRNLVFFYFMT